MIKRHPWFTFYTFIIGLIPNIICLIISLCLRKSDSIFISTLVTMLFYLFLFFTFLNSGVRKRFYEKDDSGANDYKYITLIEFGIFAVIFIVTCVISLSINF